MATESSQGRARLTRVLEAILGTVVGGIILAMVFAYAGILWSNIQEIRTQGERIEEQNERISNHFGEIYPQGVFVLSGEIAELKDRLSGVERSLSEHKKALEKIQDHLATLGRGDYARVNVAEAPKPTAEERKKEQEQILQRIPLEKDLMIEQRPLRIIDPDRGSLRTP